MFSEAQKMNLTIKNNVLQWCHLYLKYAENGVFVNCSGTEQSQCVSEAQGYGMLIVVQAAALGWCQQSLFDALVDYYLVNQISSTNCLMSWKQTQLKTKMRTEKKNQTSATDGDMDIAYALFLADELWGDSSPHNYRQIALGLLNALLERCFHNKNQLLTIGDWATKEIEYCNLIRSSDLNLHYFSYFYGKTLNESWLKIKARAEWTLKYASRLTETGLIADFLRIDGQRIEVAESNSLESNYDDAYYWNANRLPWRLSLDNNVVAGQIVQKMLNFFNQQPIIYAGYALSGRPLVMYSSMAFRAPILFADNYWNEDSQRKEMARNELLDMTLVNEYYADSIYVLVLMKLLKESQ